MHLENVSTLRWRLEWKWINYVRHESSSDSLEEESDGSVEAGEVGTKTEAQSQNAGEKRDDGEEERDDVEREHESAHVVELVRADESIRDVLLSAEVVWRVERQRRLGATAVRILSVLCSAKREECPARRVPHIGPRDAVGSGLEEVDVADGSTVGGTGEDDEELEEDAAGEDDQCDQSENGALKVLLVFRSARQSVKKGLRVRAMAVVVS